MFRKLVEAGIKPDEIKLTHILKNNSGPETASRLIQDLEKYWNIAVVRMRNERNYTEESEEEPGVIDTSQ